MNPLLKFLSLLGLLAACGQSLAESPIDLPTRVGRIAYVQGDVSFQSAFGEEPIPAVMNWPIASQNIVTTGRNSRAEIRVGSTAVRIAGETNLEIAELDDDRFLLFLTDGSVHVRVGKRDAESEFSIRTPQGRVQPSGVAVLRIDIDREAGARVTVYQGAAQFDDNVSSVRIAAGKRADVQGGEIRLAAAKESGADAFGAWSRERDRLASRAPSQGYAPPDMTGVEELDRHGIWERHEEYGTVWYPTVVASNWAPYRAGHWAWIAPWGWTWIDQAPWGYAPSHYGRWAQIDRRWGWVPGPANVRHVWAPALVGWIGGRHWNASFSFGQAPAVGWFPLGPYEPYDHHGFHHHVVDGYRPRSNSARIADHPSQIRVMPRNSAALPTDIDERRYRNRFVPNAVSVLPQERFLNGQQRPMVPVTGVVVAQPRQVRDAVVSPSAPIPASPSASSSVGTRVITPNDPMRGQARVVVPSSPSSSVRSGFPQQQAPSAWTDRQAGSTTSSRDAMRPFATENPRPIAPQGPLPGANRGMDNGNRFGQFDRPSALDRPSSPSSGNAGFGRPSGGVVVQPPTRSGGAAIAVPQGNGGIARPSGAPTQGGGIMTR